MYALIIANKVWPTEVTAAVFGHVIGVSSGRWFTLKRMNPDRENPQTLPPDTLNEAIGVLTRREVEARILKPFVEALGERFGDEAVREVLAETVERAAKEIGAQMRARTESDDLKAFASQWEPWFRGGALEIDELKRTDDVWHFNVTCCRYAELYRSLGLAELGATLSCNRDAALIEGFGDDVMLERTQTIMEGASYCDFRYRRVGKDV